MQKDVDRERMWVGWNSLSNEHLNISTWLLSICCLITVQSDCMELALSSSSITQLYSYTVTQLHRFAGTQHAVTQYTVTQYTVTQLHSTHLHSYTCTQLHRYPHTAHWTRMSSDAARVMFVSSANQCLWLKACHSKSVPCQILQILCTISIILDNILISNMYE